ncbi:phosphotyrosine protein [Wolfiporia cocos MD-104 SS10]|uniref:Phosphotyrosine protein n=1 Tax=Wolfiporia cocos (strain MD-104) TaxID=742152 RepID=A0A2H3IWB3_WOLCO|nr:phosphotyrosine protein [Wolfiporia cocos MD-104 SS10]
MAAASPTLPEWLNYSRLQPHLVTVLGTLSERERIRATARQASYQRSNPSRAHRFSRLLPALSSKPDYASRYAVSVGGSPDHERENRYSDIIPYDRTRVVVSSTGLEKGGMDSAESRYLNANWVRELAGGKWWIATQAPLPNTAHTFLSAIMQPVTWLEPASSNASVSKVSRIRTVVQLTQNFESGMRKAHVYFPEEEGQSWNVFPDKGSVAPTLKVTLIRATLIEEAQCVKSTVSIEPLTSSHVDPVVFTHLLYGSWPDHGIPSAQNRESLLRFIRLVDDVNRDLSSQPITVDLDPNPPIMVNCSAGVGRTGAFIALSSLLRANGFLRPAGTSSQEPPLTPSPLGPLPQGMQDDLVAQEIDMLREQRPGMVQRDSQVTFIYEMLLAAFGHPVD